MRPTCRVALLLLAIVISASTADALQPVAVTAGDLDGNGVDDAAVLGDDQIFLIKSNGDRTFTTFNPSTVSTRSTGGFAITTGLFDNNRTVDLAVSDELAAGQVSVLLGNGDGTFKAANLNNVGDSPEGIAVADLDDDGAQDITAIDNGEIADMNVSLLYGNNNGTFRSQVRTTAGVTSVGVTTADFDQDGKVDLAVSNLSDGFGVSTLRNDPGCSDCVPPTCDCMSGFDLKDIPNFGNAVPVQAGIVDGDAKPDLVAVSDDGSTIGVFFNISTGPGDIEFSVATVEDLDLDAMTPNEMILVDVNKDGRADILAISGGNDGVNLFLNDGMGNFPATPTFISVGESLVAIASGDFDNDGNRDIVVTDDSLEQAIFLFGDGKGSFGDQQVVDVSGGSDNTPTPAGGTATATRVLMTATPTRTPTVTGTFTPTQTLTATPVPTPYGVCNKPIGPSPIAVATGDFDHDGNQDIAVALADTAAPRVVLLLSKINPDGASACEVLNLMVDTNQIDLSEAPIALTAADFNVDGYLDLAVLGASGVSVFINDRQGGFTPLSSQPMPVGLDPKGIATADFNHDGVPDIIVATLTGGVATIFVGQNGTSLAFAPCSIPINRSATGVVTADLNLDGNADFAVFSDQTNQLSIFLQMVPTPGSNQSCPTFRNPAPNNFSAVPRALVVGQLNQDDLTPDFGVALLAPGNIGQGQSLLGRISGTNVSYDAQPVFSVSAAYTPAPATPTPVQSRPSAIGAGDVNRDGLTDLVIADELNNAVVVFLGQADLTFKPLDPINVQGQRPVALVLDDIDGDGRPDAVVANQGDGSVSVLLTGSAPATPTPVPTFTASFTPPASATQTATPTFTYTPTALATVTPTNRSTRTPTSGPTLTPTATIKGGTISLGSCAIDRRRSDWSAGGLLALALCGWLNRRRHYSTRRR